MVEFKVDLINLAIHVMHFGKYGMDPPSIYMLLSCLGLYRSACVFRIGAVLKILGGYNFVDSKALCGFLLACQYKVLQ